MPAAFDDHLLAVVHHLSQQLGKVGASVAVGLTDLNQLKLVPGSAFEVVTTGAIVK